MKFFRKIKGKLQKLVSEKKGDLLIEFAFIALVLGITANIVTGDVKTALTGVGTAVSGKIETLTQEMTEE